MISLPRLHLQGVPSHHHRASRINHDLRLHGGPATCSSRGGLRKGGHWRSSLSGLLRL